MAAKWNFNNKTLEEIIKKGYVLLEDPITPKSKRKSIATDIETFKRFSAGNYNNWINFSVKPPHDIERLKKYILFRMREQYDILGRDLIAWTMDLCSEEIFKGKRIAKKTSLSIDEQEIITLENYASTSRIHLPSAKALLAQDIISQIQCSTARKITSYCYHDEITNLPFLVVNPDEGPWTLNHEIEHAIEDLKKYNTNSLYYELGPILFEMLFNDTLYKRQGYLNVGDYSTRQRDTQETLDKLQVYFDIMLVFADYDFNVPTSIFLNEFANICDKESEKELKDFLRKEIAPPDIFEEMNYLYSYLAAIKLRETYYQTKRDCADILEPSLSQKKFNFNLAEDLFNTYKRFNEEMKSKSKIK